MEYVVSPEEHGISLLAFLEKKNEKAFSLKKLKKIIEERNCKVGDRVECFSSRKLAAGEVINVSFPSQKVSKSQAVHFEILFEDPDFIVVNKPSNVVSTDESFASLGNVKLVHRLDKDTTGLLLLAKNSQALCMGEKLFLDKVIKKSYLALVDGHVTGKRGVIDNYLGKVGGYEGQSIYGAVSLKDGKRAITEWIALEAKKEATFLLCDLKTGRTHQIRAHLAGMGHPILGDYQYAKKRFISSVSFSHHLLHAWKLSFIHPKTKKQVFLISPIPGEFQKALNSLGFQSPLY